MLWWVDIDGRRIHRYDATFAVDSHKELPGRPGAVALTGEFDRLLVAMENELLWFDWDDGNSRTVDPARTGRHRQPAQRRCMRSERPVLGGKYVGDRRLLPAASTVSNRAEPSRPPNGGSTSPTAWRSRPTRRRCTSPIRIVAPCGPTTTTPTTGSASAERVFVEFGTDLPGKPDGATVDEAGCYWVACVYGWSVARIDPKGRIDKIIELPVEKPTKPAFGGTGLDVLYVTTIGAGALEPTVTHQPDDGAVFALDVGVAGIAEPRFGSWRAAAGE